MGFTRFSSREPALDSSFKEWSADSSGPKGRHPLSCTRSARLVSLIINYQTHANYSKQPKIILFILLRPSLLLKECHYGTKLVLELGWGCSRRSSFFGTEGQWPATADVGLIGWLAAMTTGSTSLLASELCRIHCCSAARYPCSCFSVPALPF